MSDPTTPPEETTIETEEEFRALYNDAQEGGKRLLARAATLQATHPEIAELYREINGSVLSLLSDMAASCGGAFSAIEDNVEELFEQAGDEPVTESVLLAKDGKDFLDYLAQMLRLVEELTKAVPDGVSGDAQREIFAKLHRLTEDRIEFTKSITEEDDDEETEKDEDDDEPTPQEH